jgi:soluble lytic murein transglycosylase-like protein
MSRAFAWWLGAVALAVSAWIGTDARADIYTYVDEHGVTHYTNVPPSGRRSVRRIRTEEPPSAPRVPRGGGGGGRESVAERFDRYDPFIREAAALYRLPESFLRAVMKVESNGNASVVSHAGACGLMQLMPATAARMGVTDIFDPRQNILGGARFLRVLANTFNGDLVLVIAAYNAGQGAVIRYRGIPPYEETQRYVRRVLTWYYGFLEAESRAPALTN